MQTKKLNKQINFYLGKGAKNKKDQREIDKQMKVADADTAAKAQAEKDEQDDFDKRTSSKVKNLVTSADKELKDGKKKESAGADRLMAAIKNVPNKKEPKTVKATTVPKKPKEEKPKEQKLKRPNIRSYKGDREGYEKARAAYNAQKPENKTKVGNQGRPKKNKDIKEATGRIAMMKAAKEKGKVIKMRTYSQMKQDEAREAALKNAQRNKAKTGQFEQFSHWREEFLWEVDKKYPDKVKEIKPMSGKNTIIINPEDESAKYKRGY